MRTILLILVFFAAFNSSTSFAQTTVYNSDFHYKLTLPVSLVEHVDNASVNDEKGIDRLFYDTVSEIALMITAREGNYTDINAYLDCTRADLEIQLKNYEGDTSLHLIECRKPDMYPDQSALLHFETSSLGNGFDRCIIFFVHHRNKEIQFSFVYNKKKAVTAVPYILHLMQSLKLE